MCFIDTRSYAKGLDQQAR